jgi:hypothetical protein
MKRFLQLALLPVALLACSSGTRASTGRTERETDSVIGQSQVPGAPVVQKALDASDSARARIAAQDSIATAE